MQHRYKCLDAFTRIRDATGAWPKLDTLLAANGFAVKTHNGAEAITLWEAGRRDELLDYCRGDVRRTAEITLAHELRMDTLLLPERVYGVGTALGGI